jgi:putative ABC transport system permease protein
MPMAAVTITLGQVAAALALVGVAIAVSFWRRAELERDLSIAVLRSFVQLTAIGYVIRVIFNSNSLWVVAGLLTVMVGVGTWTARSRARSVPGATLPIAIGLGVAVATTIGLVVALGVFDPKARYLVPVGGMVIGNAMTSAAVALNRLADEVRSQARTIEATLALGATARQATAGLAARSLRSGMIPVIDQTKTVGIVAFPGAMVGMLLAGAEPVQAVRLQLVLLWVLMGAVALSAVIAISLGYRGFFTDAHQLKDL